MCGIFAVINDPTKRAAERTLEGLKRLEYRGYDSWGIAVVGEADQKLRVEKHVGKIGEAKLRLPRGEMAIGHTRWATHGGVTDENAHPHLDCTGRIVVIHNGIVENYQDLRSHLTKRGHRFSSETDTEVIAHFIEERLKTEPIERAVFSVFKNLVGSNAVAVLDSKLRTILACRNGSPLVVGVGRGQFFLASDVTPFLKETRQALFLSDGEAVVLTASSLKLYDIGNGREKNYSLRHLDWKVADAEKGGYRHFLLKEITEQVSVIPKTAVINRSEILRLTKVVKNSKRIMTVACGTASYCALATKYFLAEVGFEAQAYGAYEFSPFSRFIDSKTVVLAVSQSGETADTLIAAKLAKKKGAYLVAVVNARGSTLERIADAVLPVGAGPEIAVVSTKAFTAQLATLYLLSRALVGKYRQAQDEIRDLGQALKSWFKPKLKNRVLALSRQLMNQEDMYVIGKHLQYCSALEFALKIKESSYIHAEPFAAGELKHGVITLIQKGTPCFVLAANDGVRLELLSSAAELKARGGMIIGVAPFKAAEFDECLRTPDLGCLTIIPNVMVGQLLGYYLGVGRGADPDKPRNLAKSVTVK